MFGRKIRAGLATCSLASALSWGAAAQGWECMAPEPPTRSGNAPTQEQQGLPKPGPEPLKLLRFIGKWISEGQMQPGPAWPGGPVRWKVTCRWSSAGLAVTCKSKGEGPLGKGKGIGILSYDPEAGVYTYYSVDRRGCNHRSEGRLNGGVWTFTSESEVGDKIYVSRFIIQEISDKKRTFEWVTSEDGSTWVTLMTGESRRRGGRGGWFGPITFSIPGL